MRSSAVLDEDDEGEVGPRLDPLEWDALSARARGRRTSGLLPTKPGFTFTDYIWPVLCVWMSLRNTTILHYLRHGWDERLAMHFELRFDIKVEGEMVAGGNRTTVYDEKDGTRELQSMSTNTNVQNPFY